MASSGSNSSSQSQPTPDSEQIAKLKQLISYLEVALMNLMNQADTALQQNVESGESGKTDEDPHRLERSVEDFMNMSDQLEDLLETMKASERQTALSMKYTPKPVPITKSDLNQDTQTYGEYLNVARTQIMVSNELQELLADFVKSQLT